MRSDWSFRWWDLITLGATLLAAVLVVQYALPTRTASEGSAGQGPVKITVRLFSPAADVVKKIMPGDEIFDSGGRTIGNITAITSEAPGDWLVGARIQGALPLFRNLAGSPRMPLLIKPGVWCLLSSFNYECAGQVMEAEPGP